MIVLRSHYRPTSQGAVNEHLRMRRDATPLALNDLCKKYCIEILRHFYALETIAAIGF